MLTRFFDADGMPRDRALWLVFAGMAASLLLAFWVVCVHQVERAEARQGQGQPVAQDCTRSGAGDCARQSSATASLQMGSNVR